MEFMRLVFSQMDIRKKLKRNFPKLNFPGPAGRNSSLAHGFPHLIKTIIIILIIIKGNDHLHNHHHHYHHHYHHHHQNDHDDKRQQSPAQRERRQKLASPCFSLAENGQHC